MSAKAPNPPPPLAMKPAPPPAPPPKRFPVFLTINGFPVTVARAECIIRVPSEPVVVFGGGS